MTEEKKSPYGGDIAKPDQKTGVEVGGGEKAAANDDRQKANPSETKTDDDAPAKPDDPDEAMSPT